jgi:hypothetical protein
MMPSCGGAFRPGTYFLMKTLAGYGLHRLPSKMILMGNQCLLIWLMSAKTRILRLLVTKVSDWLRSQPAWLVSANRQ